MAAMDKFSKANQLFVDENYQEAVNSYTEAITEDSTQADFFANRSHAFIKLENNEDAVKDAIQALILNPKHTKAMMRKGIALFNQDKFSEAKEAFQEGKSQDGEDTNFDMWIRKCDAELNLKPTSENGDQTQVGSSEAAKEIPMPVGPKTRYDWYQTERMVIITVMIKGVKKEDLEVNIEEQSLSASIKLPTGSDYTLELELLHPIMSDKAFTKILNTKVEIKLPKAEGIRWEKLERDHTAEEQQKKVKHFNPAATSDAADTASAAAAAAVIKYPSSSHYTRDWDKVVADIKEEEKGEKLEGDQALNNLFQQIYSDGNEETRKAMNKSFVESGGTVLSTNWDDIKKKETDIKAPDGMEYKKWQQ